MDFIKGIDHVQLAAPSGCEEKAREFYGEILGLVELKKPQSLQGRGGCWFQCGIQEIHIGVQEDFIPATKAHPGIIIENIEEFKRYLANHGIASKEDTPIGGRERVFVDDPFGNRLEFIEFAK